MALGLYCFAFIKFLVLNHTLNDRLFATEVGRVFLSARITFGDDKSWLEDSGRVNGAEG